MSYEISANGIKVEHSIRLTKPAIRALQDTKVHGQIEAIMAGAMTGARKARGWDIALSPTRNVMGGIDGNGLHPHREYNRDGAISGEYIYHVWLDVTCTPQTPRKGLDSEFKNILNSIDAKASYNGKWAATLVDGKPYNAADAVDANVSGDVGYAPITVPDDFGHYFQHLYGLDSHIAIVKAALDRAVADKFTKRYHTALIGPPGCGKSDICQSVKAALGEESVLEFDATSTTMAGAQKELQEREELPRVLVIEEIEKVVSDNSASWLLSVLDMRGEIRKTTARGNILKETRMIGIATVNDEETFKKMSYGALASRFMNKVYFQRPSREILERIVLREIRSIKEGREEWCKPTLDYCDEFNIADPREVIAIALCGADSLLDGSYQQHLRATAKSKWEEK